MTDTTTTLTGLLTGIVHGPQPAPPRDRCRDCGRAPHPRRSCDERAADLHGPPRPEPEMSPETRARLLDELAARRAART